jgi:hypothetical protein
MFAVVFALAAWVMVYGTARLGYYWQWCRVPQYLFSSQEGRFQAGPPGVRVDGDFADFGDQLPAHSHLRAGQRTSQVVGFSFGQGFGPGIFGTHGRYLSCLRSLDHGNGPVSGA